MRLFVKVHPSIAIEDEILDISEYRKGGYEFSDRNLSGINISMNSYAEFYVYGLDSLSLSLSGM